MIGLIHTVELRRFSGVDVGGAKYDPPVTLRCRVELGSKKAKRMGDTAQEVIASGLLFFEAGTRMEPESRIKWEGRDFSVLSVEPVFGFRESHVEVLVL